MQRVIKYTIYKKEKGYDDIGKWQ